MFASRSMVCDKGKKLMVQKFRQLYLRIAGFALVRLKKEYNYDTLTIWYLYDDHFTLIVNASTSPQREKDIPLDDIEKAFENGEKADCGTCSAINDTVPPKNHLPYGG